MTVNPGFGGQKFIEGSLRKITEAAGMIRAAGREIRLQVDGGVDATNAGDIARAGADVLVSGNSVFSGKDIPAAIARLRKAAAA